MNQFDTLKWGDVEREVLDGFFFSGKAMRILKNYETLKNIENYENFR